ncbi:MAG: hypothetical protein GF401_18650 [Chitinivibrionales bacterium]|nr:hypothetical protein [Chitinivibrionales bacterium]
MRRIVMYSAFFWGFNLLFCSDVNTPQTPYVPSVVFEGYVNGGKVTLEGNRYHPNACSLDVDTVVIFVCSKDYAPSGTPGTPVGSYMRLLILPFNDTIPRTKIGTKEVKFRFTSHHMVTQSYEVVPKDSLARNERYVRMDIESFARRGGTRISLTGFQARAPVMMGTVGREPCVIDRGILYGAVGR